MSINRLIWEGEKTANYINNTPNFLEFFTNGISREKKMPQTFIHCYIRSFKFTLV
jgi:hypothetical protein